MNREPRPRLLETLAVLSLSLPALTACGDRAERPVAWKGSMDTLAGGAVRVSNPAAGLWETGVEAPWELVPETVIGALEGDPDEVFSSVAGLAADDEGRILAIDRDSQELRFYAADGTYVKAVGREGKGPGEYSAPNGVGVLPSDSLLVVDQQGARYTVLGPDGGFGRTIQRQLPFYGWVFYGGVDHGRVYEVWHVGEGDDREPALIGTSLREPGAPMDTIPLPSVREPELHFEAFEVHTERFGSYLSVPFAPGMIYELDGDGGVWFGRGDQFRLFHASFGGDTLREIVLAAEPVPVTKPELDAWMESEAVQSFVENGGEIDTDRIPTSKPFFDGLSIDAEGNLWASIPAGPNEVRFAVFDPEGRYLGRLGFEGAQRVSWLRPVIAAGRLYVVTQDELGVHRIRTFIARDAERLEAAED